MGWLLIFASILLAVLHLNIGRLHFITHLPRSKFLSAAGGISVAYVFLHILPELNKYQETLENEIENGLLNYLSHHVYIAALFGLIIFYSMEKIVIKSRKPDKSSEDNMKNNTDTFWPHVALFFFYNALIGYLLLYEFEENGWPAALLLMIVMGTHFLVIDFSLRHHHEETYDKYGRWILAAAIIMGTVGGILSIFPDAVFNLMFAFLSGAIILNVLKEELPEERKSSLGAFISGAAIYIVLLQLLLTI